MRDVHRHIIGSHIVYRRPIPRHVVGNIIFQGAGVNGGTYHAAHDHVEHLEHGKGLEEMLEAHYFFRAGQEGHAQHGIPEPAASHRQIQLGDMNAT